MVVVEVVWGGRSKVNREYVYNIIKLQGHSFTQWTGN